MEYKLKNGTTITDTELEQLAAEAEHGNYPGTSGEWIVRPVGRPKTTQDDLVTIAVRIPRKKCEEIDRAAKNCSKPALNLSVKHWRKQSKQHTIRKYGKLSGPSFSVCTSRRLSITTALPPGIKTADFATSYVEKYGLCRYLRESKSILPSLTYARGNFAVSCVSWV
ncbi:hypothetical protein RQN30_08390 [Arcanobacterium hippocoleae]